MGIFNFFKKKTKTSVISIAESSPEQELFGKAVLRIIGSELIDYDFALYKAEIRQYATTIIYRKKNNYVKVNSSNYPTDYPYYYNIILGEGNSDDFFEWDWNSVALWRLIDKIDPLSKPGEYAFPIGDEVPLNISKAAGDLIKYADSFLKGDLTAFYETLSEQNKNRDTYKIYKPDGTGHYKKEELNVPQKKKFD